MKFIFIRYWRMVGRIRCHHAEMTKLEKDTFQRFSELFRSRYFEIVLEKLVNVT